MECKSCGTGLKPGAKFCPKCGTAASGAEAVKVETISCIACVKPLKPGAKFCAHCGATQMVKPVPPPTIAPPVPVPTTAAVQVAVPTVPDVSIKPNPAPIATTQPEPARASAYTAQVTRPPELQPERLAVKRKTWLVWLAGGLAVVAIAGGAAWYLKLLPGLTPEIVVAKPVQPAPQPVVATPMPEEAPIEPPPIILDNAAPATSAPTSLPAPLVAPKNTASAAPPAKAPSQNAPVAKPAWRTPQKNQATTEQSTSAAQPAQSSPAWASASKAEPQQAEEKPATSPPVKEKSTKDPYAKCDKYTGFGSTAKSFLCRQRVKEKICEGKWGTTPDCPARNESENAFDQ